MTLTTIDPKPALIVIDLQRGIVAAPTIHSHAGDRRPVGQPGQRVSPSRLACGAGQCGRRTDRGRPGFTPSPGGTNLVRELDAQLTDLLVSKHGRSAFAETTLHADLQHLEVTQIVLAGISTTTGVESTARAAYDLGYHVVLATDAMTDRDPDAHHSSITRIFPGLGGTATTREILAKLKQTPR
jgi:nicotinamidase-related amidase